MKVLLVTHHFLDDNGGGSFASRAYINAFSEVAESCMVLYPDRGRPVSAFLNKNCIQIGIYDHRSNLKKALDVLRGRIHRYSDVLMPKVKSFDPDIIVFDNSICSGGLIAALKKTGKKVVIIHHNYMVEYFLGTKPFTGWKAVFLNQPFMHYMKKIEKESILNADLNLTLTHQDIDLLQNHYDPDKTSPMEKWGCFEFERSQESVIKEYDTKTDLLTFAITGSLASYQTEVSVIPFLQNLYPELLKQLPDSKLILAGRNPSNKMKIACEQYPSISLIANPENMQEVLTTADIYICPTSVGGGLKLRVMDGLKAGLPVLTHAVSARGYDEFKDAGYLFVYEDQISFKECLGKIIEAKKLDKFNRNDIIETYWSQFSFDSGVKRLKILMSNLMSDH